METLVVLFLLAVGLAIVVAFTLNKKSKYSAKRSVGKRSLFPNSSTSLDVEPKSNFEDPTKKSD